MKLLMARHGQSRWQVEGDIAGTDTPLTALGELQAHRLGEYLAKRDGIAAVFTSNLKRAQGTAEIVASYLNLPVQIDPNLQEFDEWEAGWAPSPAAMLETSPGESVLAPGYSRFRRRVYAALRRIVEGNADGATVLIIAHGGTIGVILRILLGSDTPRLWAWNAALHKVEWNRPHWGESWVFHYLNNMEHLPSFLRTS